MENPHVLFKIKILHPSSITTSPTYQTTHTTGTTPTPHHELAMTGSSSSGGDARVETNQAQMPGVILFLLLSSTLCLIVSCAAVQAKREDFTLEIASPLPVVFSGAAY